MTTEQIIAFLVFSTVAAITPGPSNVLLTATGANVGVARGFPCLLGVSVGMGVMMFVVAFGLGNFVLDNPTILGGLKWCGGALLLWLAWRIASASRSETGSGKKPVGFLGAAAFQWINPKSWLVSASAAGTYLSNDAGSALLQSASFGLLFFLAAFPSCFLWLAFGVGVQRFLHADRAFRIFNIILGILLAGSVILIVW